MELAQTEPRKPTAKLLLLSGGIFVGMLILVVGTLSALGVLVSFACVIVAAIVALWHISVGKKAAPAKLAAGTWGLVAMSIGAVAGLASFFFEAGAPQASGSAWVAVVACLQIGAAVLIMIPCLVMRASARRAMGDYGDDTLTPPLYMP